MQTQVEQSTFSAFNTKTRLHQKTNTNSRFLVRQTKTDKKYIRNHSVIQTLWSILNSGSGVNAAAKTNGEEHCITFRIFILRSK